MRVNHAARGIAIFLVVCLKESLAESSAALLGCQPRLQLPRVLGRGVFASGRRSGMILHGQQLLLRAAVAL